MDKLWKREGRADFAAYISRVCKRAEVAGLIDQRAADMPAKDRKALDRIVFGVIDEMVRSARIQRP